MSSRTESPSTNRRDWHNLQSMLPFLWEYRGRALFALACLILSKVATVGVPVLLKDLVDALQTKPQAALGLPMALLLGYGALRLASALFNELRDTIFARVRYHAMRNVSVKVLEHLHHLSLRFHLERKTGAITRDIERGTASVSSLMNYMVFSIIPIAVEFGLVAFILLHNYTPIFAGITFVTVITYVWFTVKITEWRMDHRHLMNRLDSQSSNQAIDSLVNYETVKYFNNETLELQRFDNTLAQWEEAAVKSQTSMSILNFGQSAIIGIGVTFIMFFAAAGVLNGTMSIGDLVMVNAFMLQLFLPLSTLGIVYRQIKYTLADMDMVFRLLDTAQEVTDCPNAPDLQITRGEIRFENVDFGYQPERPILRGVSFSVPAGAKVAVVGHSGAGKSTLARLLYRFYDVTHGRILIDGQDIASVSQASLRKAIGIVPQDTVLFNDSLRYNLQYSNTHASQTDLGSVDSKQTIY